MVWSLARVHYFHLTREYSPPALYVQVGPIQRAMSGTDLRGGGGALERRV